jgi:Major Facilitator Superfamily
MNALAVRRGGLLHALVALLPTWFAWAGSVAVIGWLVFVATKSPAVVGAAFAVRMAPLVLAGLPIGTLSDRLGRILVLQIANLGIAAIFAGLAVLAVPGPPNVALVIAAAAALGVFDAGRMVCGNNLMFELAGDLGPTKAIAASNFGGAIGQIAGSAVAGAALNLSGPTIACAIVAASSLVSAALLFGLPDHANARHERGTPFVAAVHEGLALLRRLPAVGLLIAAGCVVEMFAFSCVALDPSFAGQVFMAGPAGLGWILASRALGRLVGASALVVFPARRGVGRALALSVIGFGLGLVIYAVAPALLLALPFIFTVGITSLVVDALVLTAVQAGVHAAARGRAVGLWVLMIGLQPIGLLEVGLVAQLAGARWAQSINGSIVIVFGVAMLFMAFGRRISDMETISSQTG